MKPLISELSYGYALTQDLATGRLGPLRGAPIFPSLIEEGRAGGGYDVRLPRFGIPLFLQFKLSHHMERITAGEWWLFRTSYYRMHLRPLRLSRQHRLLQELEDQGNEVYYAAPEFHTLDELNDAYLNDKVVDRSAFFSPLNITLPDNREHYIAFSKQSPIAWCCSSDPRSEVRKISGADLLRTLSGAINARGKEITEDFFESLVSQLLQVLEKVGIRIDEFVWRQLKQKEPREKIGGKMLAGYLARSYFESELSIYGDDSEFVAQMRRAIESGDGNYADADFT